jgi:hypothetical protein
MLFAFDLSARGADIVLSVNVHPDMLDSANRPATYRRMVRAIIERANDYLQQAVCAGPGSNVCIAPQIRWNEVYANYIPPGIVKLEEPPYPLTGPSDLFPCGSLVAHPTALPLYLVRSVDSCANFNFLDNSPAKAALLDQRFAPGSTTPNRTLYLTRRILACGTVPTDPALPVPVNPSGAPGRPNKIIFGCTGLTGMNIVLAVEAVLDPNDATSIWWYNLRGWALAHELGHSLGLYDCLAKPVGTNGTDDVPLMGNEYTVPTGVRHPTLSQPERAVFQSLRIQSVDSRHAIQPCTP